MKKIITLLLVFSLYFSLFFVSNIVKADTEASVHTDDPELKLVDLTGATITFTEKLTAEKINKFVEENQDLLEFDGNDYILYFWAYGYGADGISTFIDCFVFSSEGEGRPVLIAQHTKFNIIFYVNSLGTNSNLLTYENLHECDEYDKGLGLLQNEKFIEFILDTCEVQGGTWEETTGESDSSLIITTSIKNMHEYSQLIFYKTDSMLAYQPLNIAPGNSLSLTGLTTIQFKNMNPDISSFIIRYDNNNLKINYGEESKVINLNNVFMMDASISLTDQQEENEEKSEFMNWLEELPMEVLIIFVAVVAIILVLIFKK